MSADKRWRLLCYDIREPKRWRKVHRLMRGSGSPVQYSVFRARLDDRELEHLRWELAMVMDGTDALLVVDLCPSCARRVVSRNSVQGWTEEEPTFVILPQQSAAGVDQAPPRGAGSPQHRPRKRMSRKGSATSDGNAGA
jgi:CRISPR-associated protein Cas2